jgi:tetratricopeptide (TPR) repeat protein
VAALDAIVGRGTHGAVDPLGAPGTLVRALGFYVAAFLAVAGLARVAMIALALPDWVFPGALAVMALGVPAILVTALLHHRARTARAEGRPATAAGAVVQAFRTDLAQSAVVTLPSSSALREALQRMQRPPTTVLRGELARELAAREGIRVVVEGDVRALGGGYVLSTRLVAPTTGEVLAAFRETADGPSEIVGAIDRLSKSARARIGESYRSVRAAPALERVTTASFPALEKYTQAMTAERRGEESPRVIERLREAVAIDSTFAMAYAQMCCLGRLPASQAVELGARAMRYRDKLPAAERYEVEMVQYGLQNEPDSLLVAARNALDLDSLNVGALRALGVAHGRRREFAEAERYFARTFVADSAQGRRTAPGAFGALARVQYQQGNEAAARRTLERGLALYPAPFGPVAGRMIELDFATGRYDEAERRLRAALAAAPPSGEARGPVVSQMMQAAILRGRLGEALRTLDSLADGHARQGRHAAAFGTRVQPLFFLADVLEDTAAVRAGLGDLLRRYPLDSMPPADRPYHFIARLQARIGDLTAAEAMVREYERVTRAVVGRRDEGTAGHYAGTRAYLASLRGEYPRALALAREADVGNCPACPMYLFAMIHERAGAADSARAVFERYLATPNMERLYSASLIPRVHERLGQLHEQAGDRVRAAAHYAAFVELWKNADPALQPRVRAARDALSRLRATG